MGETHFAWLWLLSCRLFHRMKLIYDARKRRSQVIDEIFASKALTFAHSCSAKYFNRMGILYFVLSPGLNLQCLKFDMRILSISAILQVTVLIISASLIVSAKEKGVKK
jgi:hypothetical protein